MFDRQTFQQVFDRLPCHFSQGAIALHHYEVLESTNTTAWELLKNGASSPLVVIADRQTAGRGQWGRQWQSDRGGLYLSLGMAIESAIGIHLTFSSGWGIATALGREGIPVELKWPNDLILEGKKLGGIKTVTKGQVRGKRQVYPPPTPNSPHYTVIGVGINWQNQPPEPGIALSSFLQGQSRGAIATLESLAAITTCGILSGYHYFLNEGVDALLSSYWELAIAKGRSVTINGCPGKIVGITPQGELRIRIESPGASTEICCPPGTITLGYDRKDKNFSERSLHKKS
ncbi:MULTISPECIES: biotin--[acetyl-CoA-carboxylase] ligase [Spirulina sp. CCY15215]|uniref:biotin--[acetyl-CoA-carboxylase] ligase n=1 Tax=Spirulina sp. CCY15215 TaxID=2767591 RepID=UPI001950B4E1